MRLMRNLSIKRKLTLLAMVTSTVALLVACAACMTFDVLTFRERMSQDLRMNAEIVGTNCTAALTFGDVDDARSTLSSLSADPDVVAACVYDADGRPFATFVRGVEAPATPASPAAPPDASPSSTAPTTSAAIADPAAATAAAAAAALVTLPADFPAEVKGDRARFTRRHLDVFHTILLDGKKVGTLFVRSNLDQLWARIHRYGLIMLAVLCVASGAAFLLARRLQRMISDPIQHLADTARVVSAQRDYSVRAVRSGDDELGQLMEGFNEMLGQIQARDTELRAHREHLEDEVARRTEELQKLNVDLTAARDRAEEASRAKTYFLANMSHEIRTPMTAIIGYADMMLEPDQSPSDRQDSLQIIRRSGRHLVDLINDILDISKIEAGRMTVECVGCDLPGLIVEVASLMRPRAAEKGLQFRVSSVGRIPQQIRSDPLRLRQILMNLASNAIKFTKEGQVDLIVRCTAGGEAGPDGSAAGSSVVQIEVCDTGIGMTEEQIGRLFQPFTQADESMTRRFGGTGLGLVISKRLARLLGGDIVVSSRPGAGSTFTVTVAGGSLEGVPMISELSESILCPPGGEFHAEEPSEKPRALRLGGRILLAEDGLDNQRLISSHLRRAGAEVVVAENGRIAVDLIHKEKQHFDLIVMDMQMPQLDGYGAASELRRKGYTMPIVALTAHAMAEDRAQCLRAGCTDYLTKPIDKMLLLSTIRNYLQQLGVPVPPATEAAPQAEATGSPAAPAESNPEQAPSSSPKSQDPASGNKPGTAVLESDFANDPDLREVLGDFIKGLPAQVTRLQQLLADENLSELRRTVHQLKGAGGGYGFPQISHVALRAEEHVKSGAPLEAIASQVDRLVRLIRQVQGYDRQLENKSEPAATR